jgi:acetylornithine deacetylase/succinyl-diaminopimelate desuccinylase-like protein
VKGREAHSAYPALGASAIFRAARLVTRLEVMADNLKQHLHPAFDPPFTTLNIGLIRGGSAKNVLAGECRFTLEWRPIPTQPSSHVLNLVKAAIADEQRNDPDFECEVQATRADFGFETAPDSPLVSLLEQATGIESGTVAFGTEAAQMTSLGSEAVVIGPGDIREAHSAYPALGASAIFRAARLVSRLEVIADTLKQQLHPAFDPSFTTLNIGLIRGGSAKNVLAGECRFTLEWRPIPTQPSSHVLNLVKAAIADEQRNDPEFECEVHATRADFGFETAPDSPLVSLLEQATGIESGTVAFGTEAAQMTSLGSEAVVIGPGDIREAHRTGEFVPVAELERCAEILKLAINSLCI